MQVTTDWLTLGMQEGLLDERIWKELVADCGLDPWERPQVCLLLSGVIVQFCARFGLAEERGNYIHSLGLFLWVSVLSA